MNTTTENDTLLQLLDYADKVPLLMTQLAESQQQIERLHIKLANLEAQSSPEQVTNSSDATVDEEAKLIPTELPETSQASPEDNLELEDKETDQTEAISLEVPPNLMDAISALVSSMSTLTTKFDLFLTQQRVGETPKTAQRRFLDQSLSTPTTTPPQPKSTTTPTQPKRSAHTVDRLNHVIDLMIEHNNHAEELSAKWRVSSSLLTQVTASRPTIRQVCQSREQEINAHHDQHHITRLHNRTYHQHQQLSDFFDF